MIIYGTRATHLESKNLIGETCPQCHKQGTINMSIFGRYAHLFWIPFFPAGKIGFSQCTHCLHALEVKEMPDNLKRQFQRLKASVQYPRWHFTGLGLLALAGVALGIFLKEENKANQEYLASPQVGDVYEYKTNTDHYSTLKVVEVKDKSVLVLENLYETEARGQVHTLNKEANYTKPAIEISKQELQKQYEEGKIFDVERD
ncbi:MAG: hypothetical protein KDK66_01845 [Deltaproteobacteria bacterium]|nr:hypothetical protein [Deltaproteobacteria bacterium]